MKHLFILSIVLALMLVGCVATGDVKDQVLIPLTDKIYMEDHDINLRSYHMEVSDGAILYESATKIFSLNGVQDVKILAYQLSVLKSPLFKWESIEPEILKILRR